MKRIAAIFLVALLAGSLAACGSPAAPVDATPDVGEPVESSVPETSYSMSSSSSIAEQSQSSAPPDTSGETVELPDDAPPLGGDDLSSLESAVEEGFPPTPSQNTALNPSDFLLYRSNSDMTISDFSGYVTVEDFAKIINRVTAGEPIDVGGDAEASFMALRSDYKKFFYTLTPSGLQVDGTGYAVSEEDRTRLQVLSGDPVCSAYPYWLIYMNPGRVTGASYQTEGSRGEQELGQLQAAQLGENIRWLTVAQGSGSTYAATGRKYTPGPDNFEIKFQFDSGVVYTVQFEGQTLYMESSDMSYGCKYAVDDREKVAALLYYVEMGEEIPALAEPFDGQGELNPETAKPVIYLYPEEEREVEVKLDFKGRLSYTYPEYKDGWRVTAKPDGSLTNKEDGSQHYYLFWDGTADKRDWDLSEGFVVAGGDVQSFLEEMMPKLGLLPKEYNDFITFWTPELARNPYNLIRFVTEEYEEIAPLEVTPAPDTVIRVHMAYKPLMAPLQAPEQELPEAPERQGFTLVEWGGTRVR